MKRRKAWLDASRSSPSPTHPAPGLPRREWSVIRCQWSGRGLEIGDRGFRHSQIPAWLRASRSSPSPAHPAPGLPRGEWPVIRSQWLGRGVESKELRPLPFRISDFEFRISPHFSSFNGRSMFDFFHFEFPISNFEFLSPRPLHHAIPAWHLPLPPASSHHVRVLAPKSRNAAVA